MNIHQIRSIGWLHGSGNSIILTLVFEGSSMPRRVTITRAEFDTIRNDEEQMKQTAIRYIKSTA